ncbi:MAG: hypothetical protein ABI547_02465, partial [Betaproteobacteria bacterium]
MQRFIRTHFRMKNRKIGTHAISDSNGVPFRNCVRPDFSRFFFIVATGFELYRIRRLSPTAAQYGSA